MEEIRERLPFLAIMFSLLLALILGASWAGQQLWMDTAEWKRAASVKSIVTVFALSALAWIFIFFRRWGFEQDKTAPWFLCLLRFTFWLILLISGVVLFAIVQGMILGVVVESLMPVMKPAVQPIIALTSLYVFLRFSALLPANAVGRSIKFGAIWHKAKGVLKPWLLLSLVILLLIVLFQNIALGWVGKAIVQALFFILVFVSIILIYRQRADN